MSKKRLVDITPEELKAIGKTIRDAREDLGIKQAKLAEDLGVSVQTISNWENGKSPPAKTRVHDIANILGIDEFLLIPISADKEEREWREAMRRQSQTDSRRKRIMKRILPEFFACFGIQFQISEDGSISASWEGHDIEISEAWEKLFPIAGEIIKDVLLRYADTDTGYMVKYGEGRHE